MRVTSIARLKATLSEILAGVEGGEEVLVTNRGRPVARIVPCRPERSGLHDLVQKGLVRPAEGRLDERFWRRKRLDDREDELLTALLAEREEAR